MDADGRAGSFPSFRHLRIFEAISRHENVSHAALEANISQPAATQAVMKIEKWLDLKLFHRSRTGTHLTNEGRVFLSRIRRMFDLVETALTDDLLQDAPKDKLQSIVNRLKSAHINVLIAVAGSYSFENAAASLKLSRTTVYRTARELEDIFGRELYRRGPDGLVANQSAQRLAMALSKACRELPKGADEITSRTVVINSRLFIGAQRLVSSSLLASSVNSVLCSYPSVEVKIVEGSYHQLLHELRRGRIDVMVGALERPAGIVDVVEEPLLHEPFCIAGRRDHPLLDRSSVSLRELAQLGWVLPGGNSQRNRAFEELFRKVGYRPSSCITATALTNQISILASSDRVTLLPRFELLTEPQLQVLRPLPIEIPISRMPDGLTVRADWHPSAVQACFLEQLRRHTRNAELHRLQGPADQRYIEPFSHPVEETGFTATRVAS